MQLRVVRRLAASCSLGAVLTAYFAAILIAWTGSLLWARERGVSSHGGGRALARGAGMLMSAVFVLLPASAILLDPPRPFHIGILFTLLRLRGVGRVLVPIGGGMSALCIYCTLRSWERGYWRKAQRIHYSLHTAIGIVTVLWWSDAPLARLLR
jgi:hypothetical protein